MNLNSRTHEQINQQNLCQDTEAQRGEAGGQYELFTGYGGGGRFCGLRWGIARANRCHLKCEM